MGVSSPAKLMYKSIPLDWEHVVHIAHELARTRTRTQTAYNNSDTNVAIIRHPRPVIDLDANLIGFNYIDAAKGSAQAVMECAQAGVDNGIEMVIIADGDSRHSSKRSSASRAVGREKNRMNAMEMEMKLSKSLQENADQAVIGELSKALAKERHKARRALPHDFANVLKSEVAQRSHALLKFKKSELQADPLICQRAVRGISDIVWSSDSLDIH